MRGIVILADIHATVSAYAGDSPGGISGEFRETLPRIEERVDQAGYAAGR